MARGWHQHSDLGEQIIDFLLASLLQKSGSRVQFTEREMRKVVSEQKDHKTTQSSHPVNLFMIGRYLFTVFNWVSIFEDNSSYKLPLDTCSTINPKPHRLHDKHWQWREEVQECQISSSFLIHSF